MKHCKDERFGRLRVDAEMVKTASELRMEVGKLQTEKMEESERLKIGWINNEHRDRSVMESRRGNSYGVCSCLTSDLASRTCFRALEFHIL